MTRAPRPGSQSAPSGTARRAAQEDPAAAHSCCRPGHGATPREDSVPGAEASPFCHATQQQREGAGEHGHLSAELDPRERPEHVLRPQTHAQLRQGEDVLRGKAVTKTALRCPRPHWDHGLTSGPRWERVLPWKKGQCVRPQGGRGFLPDRQVETGKAFPAHSLALRPSGAFRTQPSRLSQPAWGRVDAPGQRAPQEQGSPLGPPLWSPVPGSGPRADRAQRPHPWGAGKDSGVPCAGGNFWVNLTGLLLPTRSVLFTCAFPVLPRAACPHKTSDQGHSWVSQMQPTDK